MFEGLVGIEACLRIRREECDSMIESVKEEMEQHV
eukprot:CAMPEP_0173446706 /NCGR_PEP_ID=MMETSP1357-20121228/37155_1 /TAXON_ID=77926 /ORGANISM="Hemiselmis rufescens, Strain PCC563" /LENGTH=34 /DNA_ID= /DNA_START= /DNA_END= /DNA_ORIENTATION=